MLKPKNAFFSRQKSLQRLGRDAMALVAGSYEKVTWAFQVQTSQSPSLKLVFSIESHLSAIKSVAVSGPIAVSGGFDDFIKIYDLSSSAEVETLINGAGTVTSLSFYNHKSFSFPRNLFSASDDGIVRIYDANPFVHLKSIKVHKKGVNDLGVHPSGKLALTVGRDSCLAMLNLVRGRKSFSCRLDKEASIVRFDLEGNKFFMVKEEKISVHESEDAKLICEMENQKRVLCAANAANGLLITGGENRSITAWDTTSGKVAYCLENAHSTRVKGVVVFNSRGEANDDISGQSIVASASSDGVIRVWDLRMAGKEKPKALVEANTKSRLTCLAGSSFKSYKRRQVGNNTPNTEQDESDEEEES